MVDVVATNAKLRGRVLRILQEASGADEAQARTALEQAGGELKPALLSMLAGVSAATARAAIDSNQGSVALALESLKNSVTSNPVPTGELA
jgi:N-acetylmuramic acid 6-phosphate etherase